MLPITNIDVTNDCSKIVASSPGDIILYDIATKKEIKKIAH